MGCANEITLRLQVPKSTSVPPDKRHVQPLRSKKRSEFCVKGALKPCLHVPSYLGYIHGEAIALHVEKHLRAVYSMICREVLPGSL